MTATPQQSLSANFHPPDVAELAEMADLLRAGLTSLFVRRFKRAARDAGAPEQLVEQVNGELRHGSCPTELKLVVSPRTSQSGSSISVVGASRFFGESWPVVRETFYL